MAIFSGRSRELGRLRGLIDARSAGAVLVHGLPGVGKSALLRRVAEDYSAVAHLCPPLPDPAQRAALAVRLEAASADLADEGEENRDLGPDASWDEIFGRARSLASRAARPFVLVLDDAHRLAEARSRFARPLEAALVAARDRGVALHVVLVGRRSGLPAVPPDDTDPPLFTFLEVPPLPLRGAAPLLPGNRPHEKVRAYGVFGGIPGVLRLLDPSVTVGTNVRRLALDDRGPLHEAPLAWLEREVQTPSRYVAILARLARGEADWGRIHQGVSDLTRSGQLAPYLARLAALGAVKTRRSLDASPRSRSTRYALTDPFLAFWFRFVLPWRLSERTEEIGPYYAHLVRPGIAEHMEEVLPVVARQHMTFDAIETLGANAREGGSLWGDRFDIPVAGILASGAAYYGTTLWSPERVRPATAPSPLERLDEEVKETRFGFGRERRLRLLFTGREAPSWLRRAAARRDDALLIGAEELLGE